MEGFGGGGKEHFGVWETVERSGKGGSPSEGASRHHSGLAPVPLSVRGSVIVGNG
jgi:hypothetical protein